MKKLPLFIACLLALSFAMGQRLVVSSYVEKTSVSPKAGVSIGMENQYGMEYGGFYQDSKTLESAFMSAEQVAKLPRRYERVFWGAYVAFPMVDREYLDLKFNIRTGVVNAESFVITPSFLGGFKVTRGIKIGGGIGIRSFRPTYQTNISFSL